MPEQRGYHHGDLRAALIAEGLTATRTGGPTALVLREVTRRVGVSANAAYRHFADREALLDAVAEEILTRVAAGMHGPPDAPTDQPADRLRAIGLGYIQFARAEPGWFSVAFFRDSPAAAPAEPAAPPYLALTEALDELVVAGVLSDRQREGAQWSCWSAVHGFAELVLHGPLRTAPATQIDELAERTVDAIISGLLATDET